MEVRLQELSLAHERTKADLARATRELRELITLGTLLASERDTDVLLDLVLTKAREITDSDAGSVLLMEEDLGGGRQLRCHLVQNDSRPVSGDAVRTPIGPDSVAGYVAMVGAVLNLEDVYRPPPDVPCRFDPAVDERMGYRTRSLLAVPMKTPKGEVLGVLQLVNRKTDRARRFHGPDDVALHAIPFSARAQDLATALAAQAAVALENTRLYGELRDALSAVEESQRRIIQHERLRALGEMAGGVAHDFNNVLAVVVGRAQMLLRQVQEPALRRHVEIIEQVAQDGAQTVRRIQDFARMRRTRPFQQVDLSAVVREVVEASRPRWSDQAQARGVAYEVCLEMVSVPPVIGDPAELRESLVNLLFNALDAMPRGGRVTFTTSREDSRVYCRVSDTGAGMPEDVRQRVFEPFFTTKAEHGTGLGCSIAYGIVTRHGGEIEVESRPGEGSRFTLWLPVAGEVPEIASPARATPSQRQARILLVEDEAPVRDVLVEVLQSRGHVVVARADGVSALEAMTQTPFDLFLLDLSMPGLSGWDLAGRARSACPAAPVTLITGWGDQIDLDEARTRGVDYVVAKPFDVDDVLMVVDRALTRSQGRTP